MIYVFDACPNEGITLVAMGLSLYHMDNDEMAVSITTKARMDFVLSNLETVERFAVNDKLWSHIKANYQINY